MLKMGYGGERKGRYDFCGLEEDILHEGYGYAMEDCFPAKDKGRDHGEESVPCTCENEGQWEIAGVESLKCIVWR